MVGENIEIVNIISTYFGISATAALVILVIISIWTIIWKGLALWKSARKEHLAWFIVLLIVNTIGILEILYIYLFSKMGKVRTKLAPKEKPKKK